MGKESKKGIIKDLKRHRRDMLKIMNGLKVLDETDNGRVNRNLVNQITFTLFDLVDGLVDTNVDIYNFLYRRG